MKKIAVTALLTAALVAAAPSAHAMPAAELAGDTPRATVTIGEKALDKDPTWRETVKNYPGRVKEVWAHSPSMNRDIPLLVITPADNSVPRPILYILNGGDGGEGRANWVAQTDIINFYLDKNVNVVIPMSGKFSYYTDWVGENASLGGKQMWETFMTKELPEPLEKALGANERRAIAGMSMSATTTLLYAEHHPGFYDAIGSYSGCAQTNDGLGEFGAMLTLNRGNATLEQMWGPKGSPNRIYNDALINANKLSGPMYISNSSGLAGHWDLYASPRTGGDSSNVATQVINGGVIEGVTNVCTHDLKAKLDAAGIPATWNFRPMGTHSWGYWEDDLRDSWAVFAPALGI